MNIKLYLNLVILFCLVINLESRPNRKRPKLRTNSERNLRKLKELHEKSDPNACAEEYSGQFEGDILLSDEGSVTQSTTTQFVSQILWPNAKVIYTLDPNYSQAQKNAIRNAMDTIQNVTCVKFVARKTESAFVDIGMGYPGCFSEVGFQNYDQIMNLDNYTVGTGCFKQGTIQHELMHVMGIYHMQSATERDSYVTINWQNIIAGAEGNFDKYYINQYGVTYDYGSVMHYSGYAFSQNGAATIVPNDPNAVIGQRDGMSAKDIARINAMYCKK